MSDRPLPILPDEIVEGSAPINEVMGDDFMDNLIERRAHALRQVDTKDFSEYIFKRDDEDVDEVYQKGIMAIDFEIQRYVAAGLVTLQNAYTQLNGTLNEIERMRFDMREPEMVHIINHTLNLLHPNAKLEDYYPLGIPGQTHRTYEQQALDRIKDTNKGYAERPRRARLVAKPRALHQFMTSNVYKPYLLRKGEKGPLSSKKKTDARHNEMGAEKKIWDFLGYGGYRGGMLSEDIILAEEATRRPKADKLWELHLKGGPFANLRHRANLITRQALTDARQVGNYMEMATIMRRLLRQPDVIPQQAVGIGMLGAVALLPFGLEEDIDNVVKGLPRAFGPLTQHEMEEPVANPAMYNVRKMLGLGRTEELLHGAGLGYLVGGGPYKDKMEASIRSYLLINKGRIEDKYKEDSGDPTVELFRVPKLGALYQQFIRDSVAESRDAVGKKSRTGAKFNPFKIFGRRDREQGFLGRQIFGQKPAEAKEKLISNKNNEISQRFVVMLGNFVREHTKEQLREMGLNREALFDTVEYFTNVPVEVIPNPEAETYNPHRYAPFTTEGSRETVASPFVSGLNPMFRRRVAVVPARRAPAPIPEEEEEESSSDEERGEVGEADYEGDDEARFAGEGRVRELLHGAGLGHLVRKPRRRHLGRGI